MVAMAVCQTAGRDSISRMTAKFRPLSKKYTMQLIIALPWSVTKMDDQFMKTNKSRPIDDYCNRSRGSFKKFIGKRLQNYKKCIGCGASYNLEVPTSECEICGCKKFIADTDYMHL